MARPKLPQDKRLTRVITFRVSDAEHARLSLLAAKANKRLNQLARKLITSRAPQLIIKTHRSNDPALLKRLDRIGHNLNQLVKNAHIFGRVSPKIPELCERIEALIEEAISREIDS